MEVDSIINSIQTLQKNAEDNKNYRETKLRKIKFKVKFILLLNHLRISDLVIVKNSMNFFQ